MKLRLRKPPGNGHDVEFIFGVLFIPLLAAVLLLILRLSEHFPLYCVFHRITGYSCPACGSFRCAEQLLAGNIAQAFLSQPLVAILAAAAMLYAAYSWVVVLLKLPRLRVEDVSRGERRLMIGLAVAAILGNWAYIAFQGL